MARTPSRWLENLFTFLLLGLLVGVNLAGLWVHGQMRQAYAQEREEHYKAEGRLLALRLQTLLQKYGEPYVGPVVVQELIQRQRLSAVVAVYRPDGSRLVQAASADAAALTALLPPVSRAGGDVGGKPEGSNAPRTAHPSSFLVVQPLFGTEGQVLGQAHLIFMVDKASFPDIISRVIYELPLLLVGVLVLYWMGRQALEALHSRTDGSETSLIGEGEELRLVMDSYQQMVNRLQVKGKELERLREEERVRAESSERFSDRLVVSIPNALIVVANDGQVSVTNLQARELFGFNEAQGVGSRESGIGKGKAESSATPHSLLPTPYTEFFAGAPDIAALVAEGLRTGETQRRTEVSAELDGHRRFLEASVSPIPGRVGSRQGVLCLVNDMTEVVDLRAGLQIRETLASLGEMAAGIAHEFKNSLATISGYAQIIEREVPPNVSRPAQALRGEVAHLTQVVTDFLNFARPQDMVFSPVDLQELLEDCRERMLSEAEKRHIGISLEGAFPTVDGDATLLSRAFLNLIQNALEAIAEDAPHRQVTICAKPVERTGDDAGPYCQITVTDTGAGIPPTELGKVFIPFFTTKTRGYGIGLAIVQKVFVGHNGRVEVESRMGMGTTFTCCLPIKP